MIPVFLSTLYCGIKEQVIDDMPDLVLVFDLYLLLRFALYFRNTRTGQDNTKPDIIAKYSTIGIGQ